MQKISQTKKDKKPAGQTSKKPENINKAPNSASKPGSVEHSLKQGSNTTQPAVNLDDKPLTVEERDNLIRQINSLTSQQSEGIIQIV